MSVAVILITSAAAALILSKCLRLPNHTPLRALCTLVIWQVLLLVPVQGLGALQIAGIVERVNTAALAWGGLLLLGLTCLGYVVFWRASQGMGQPPMLADPAEKLPPYVGICAAILASSYLLFAVNLLTSYPTGPDATGYHIPAALRWLQQGSLAIPHANRWHLSFAQFSLAGNAEVGMMLLLASGVQCLVPLVNWLATSVLALATYLIAERLSGNKCASLTATFIVLSIPMVEFQSFSAYVDVYGAAYLIAAVALLVHRYGAGVGGQHFFLSLIALSSIACGISVGSKPIYYLYGLFFIVTALATVVRERSRHHRPVVMLIGTIVLGSLIPSAFWFGRGLQATRNPVYPLQVKIAGHVIFPGFSSSVFGTSQYDSNFVHSVSQWPFYPWTEWKRSPGYLLVPYSTGDGFGGAFATFAPLALIFAVYVSLARRGRLALQGVLLLNWFVMLIAWWFAMSRVLRYGLPIWVTACILIVGLIPVLETANSRIYRGLLVCSLLMTCAISSFLPFYSLSARIRNHGWTRAEFYGYPTIIDELPVGSRVLNRTGIPDMNFPLAGKNLSNWVVSGFEAPSEISVAFVREEKLDYVVELVQTEQNREPPVAGAVMVDNEVISNGSAKVRWQVWKVNQRTATLGGG